MTARNTHHPCLLKLELFRALTERDRTKLHQLGLMYSGHPTSEKNTLLAIICFGAMTEYVNEENFDLNFLHAALEGLYRSEQLLRSILNRKIAYIGDNVQKMLGFRPTTESNLNSQSRNFQIFSSSALLRHLRSSVLSEQRNRQASRVLVRRKDLVPAIPKCINLHIEILHNALDSLLERIRQPIIPGYSQNPFTFHDELKWFVGDEVRSLRRGLQFLAYVFNSLRPKCLIVDDH